MHSVLKRAFSSVLVFMSLAHCCLLLKKINARCVVVTTVRLDVPTDKPLIYRDHESNCNRARVWTNEDYEDPEAVANTFTEIKLKNFAEEQTCAA